ncbi:MAG: archaea-specific SMC-related protein [Natronomonas sp.]
MCTDQIQEGTAQLSVRAIGGIDETAASFRPGVTVLAGQNASNRTSLLSALMGVLGSNRVSIKGDADEASVELTIEGDRYHRRFRRHADTIESRGEPYLDDPELADLFAFLLESNEVRRAVATEDDLRDIIMRPVDFDEIEAEIDRLLESRRDITDRLEKLDELKDRLPGLEADRQRLRDRLEETESALAELEAELDERDLDVEQSREEKADLEEHLSELGNCRANLESVRYELETERNSLESLRSERRELKAQRAELPSEPDDDLESIETELGRIRDEKDALEKEIGDLQSVIQFNESLLDDAEVDMLSANDGSVTDRLLEGGTVRCWTCGTTVSTEDIDATIDRLRELSSSKLEDVAAIEGELENVKARHREMKARTRRNREVESRLEEIDDEIAATRSTIDGLTDRRETYEAEIETIEREIEALEDDSSEEILELHHEANELEHELGRLESELERIESEIADVEDRLSREEILEIRHEELNEELEALRTKIERTERQAIEEFNEHMETVLELLDYENLDRIWLERTERAVTEDRRRVMRSHFELHIIRRTESGTTYEDTIEHLSESEREVTGLVFALAGYLAHEVYEEVPFVLLDSLEAIDSERIARLVEYLESYVPYLVVALLDEDAVALPDDHPRIREI